MMSVRNAMKYILVTVLMVLPLLASAAPLLQAGDRVVIYGDSITEQRLYSRYLQQYLLCRYPDLNVKFYNAGWGGDTAGGALNRLQRDVLFLNPTVVTLFFGMNDGRYGPVNNDTVNAYRQNLEGIIKALQAKNIRVIVYTPGCVDYDRNEGLRGAEYNKTLEALGKAALELAKQYNCPSVDVFHPMLDYQAKHKAAAPSFTMVPDSVHPSSGGHLVMANTMLTAFGVDPMPALGTFDVANGKGDGLQLIQKDKDAIVLEATTTAPTPFWFESANLQFMEDSGFLALAGQKLTVRGLTDSAYDVYVNGKRIKRYTAAQLAAGVFVPGYYSQRGQQLHDLIMRKENCYLTTWREGRLPLMNYPDTKAAIDALMAGDEGFQSLIHDFAMPAVNAKNALAALPEGINLAKGKSYEVSDPNQYNWGIGKLTDGTWEASSAGCFASGDKDAFPKYATIDLGAAQRIGWVVLGVPGFGSTKTVKVAVSTDGTKFSEVGSHEFAFQQESRYTYAFPAVDARYVRLTYPDHYDQEAGYSKYFSFTEEVEVYSGRNAITLVPAPEGINLAEGKPYEVSDPNVYGWGIGKLTDGTWEASSAGCFASGDKDAFPKYATIDLGAAQRIGTVVLGVPGFGSTKTVKVAVSADNTNFTEVGSHEFTFQQEGRFTYQFPAVNARYVRLIYPDHYDQEAGYPKTFSFTLEAEVYAAK